MLTNDQKYLKKCLETEIKNLEYALKYKKCEYDLIPAIRAGISRKKQRLQDLKNYE